MNADRLLEVYEQISEAPDAIARLRRFVLDLAVRGKLVEQDAADEPAPKLLSRIAQERKRLHELGEIKKPKKLPAIDIAPFDLPLSWTWARIRDVTSDRGQKIPAAEFTYIDVSAINKEAGVVADPKVLAPEEAPSRARKVARKGDVIYSCVRPYLLNVAVITKDFDPAPIASTAFAILNGYGLVLPWYLWIALRSPFMVECVEQEQRGQAYPAINDKDFSLLPLPLPPIAEQHRIVAKVDELMALCDRLEEARKTREEVRDKLTAASLARLTAPDTTPEDFPAHARFALDSLPDLTTRPDQIKTLRETILNLAVRGKLVKQEPLEGSGAELLEKILQLPWLKKRKTTDLEPDEAAMASAFNPPTNWCWATVQSLVRPDEIATYGILKPEWVEDGVPTVRVTEMKTGVIDIETLPRCRTERADKFQKTTLAAGDLLVSKDGTIGKTAFVPPELVGGNITQHMLRFPIVSLVNRRFIRLAIDSPFCQSWMLGETKGVALQGVNVGDFRRMPIPFPPLAEQNRIVAKVDTLMALCDRLEASLTTVTTTRTRLLEALLHEALEPKSDIMEAAE
ncbi:restriction endonuclease subunit S [Sulfitobacter sp. HGT1]|uniref:restriction endonuclease subunit S n=1 Tax=Sulfitobacter sp. HGT1 TaxID=2735435 RepID=UPI001594C453|nr:restriction endonuclease subunit S [Sulfitobacter sp. HGT1]